MGEPILDDIETNNQRRKPMGRPDPYIIPARARKNGVDSNIQRLFRITETAVFLATQICLPVGRQFVIPPISRFPHLLRSHEMRSQVKTYSSDSPPDMSGGVNSNRREPSNLK